MQQQPALVVVHQRKGRLISLFSLAHCAMEAWKRFQAVKVLQRSFDVASAAI